MTIKQRQSSVGSRQSAVTTNDEQRMTNSPRQKSGRRTPYAFAADCRLQTADFRSAFTLVEVTISMAIGLIIMAVAAKAVQTSSRVNRVANATTEVIVTGRSTLDIMDQDLRGAFVDAAGNWFVGSDSTLTLWTVPSYVYDGDDNPDNISTGAKIGYFLIAGTSTHHGSTLVRYDVPADTDLPANPAAEADVASKALVYNVVLDNPDTALDETGFLLEYYDPLWRNDSALTGPWRSTWDSTELALPTQYRRLPAFVRIQLEVIDSAGVRDPAKISNRGYAPFKLDRVIPVGTQTPTR
jgi:prepilin-type N-terminal cleavage/methylation domain-containing protein